jgi:membrane associated rhomboid family serine protease
MTEQMIGGHVLVEAHLYGAVIGVIFALIKSAEEKFYS